MRNAQAVEVFQAQEYSVHDLLDGFEALLLGETHVLLVLLRRHHVHVELGVVAGRNVEVTDRERHVVRHNVQVFLALHLWPAFLFIGRLEVLVDQADDVAALVHTEYLKQDGNLALHIVPVIEYFLDGHEILEVCLLGRCQVLHRLIQCLVDIAEGTVTNFLDDLVLLAERVFLVQAGREEVLLLNNGLNFVVHLFGIVFSNLLDLDSVLLGGCIIDLRVR